MSGSQPTTTLPASTSPTPDTSESSSGTQVSRNNLGQFVKGVSGNPKGKPVGARNRISIIKHAIEEALVRDLAEDANLIIQQAISQAKAGDPDMIKFVLGEILKDVRKGGESDEDLLRGAKNVQVTITQYIGQPEGSPGDQDAVDGEFTTVENP